MSTTRHAVSWGLCIFAVICCVVAMIVIGHKASSPQQPTESIARESVLDDHRGDRVNAVDSSVSDRISPAKTNPSTTPRDESHSEETIRSSVTPPSQDIPSKGGIVFTIPELTRPVDFVVRDGSLASQPPLPDFDAMKSRFVRVEIPSPRMRPAWNGYGGRMDATTIEQQSADQQALQLRSASVGMYRSGDYGAAVTNLEVALTTASTPEVRARIESLLARAYARAGELPKAKALYIKLAESSGDGLK